ncbi:MAG: mechanosensitive ion channel family protein [Candidatus Omnitrophica bacterium]|nr:mechanosensitive ion channel family protein [Candidatus Omnitrophota bacterium]
MDAQKYLQAVGEWLITSGLQIVLIMILMVIGLKAAELLSAKLIQWISKKEADNAELQKRTDTLSSIVRYVLKIGIFVMAGMMILKELGIDIGPILATAGVVGLAVGFGAQKLVEDVISGFFILLEDQIRVGDVVNIADKGGLVEKVTLRMVILRDLAGNVHYVRNGQIGVVTNMTKEYSRYVFDIGVAYREDVDEVIEVIKAVDEELRQDPEFKKDILAPIEILGLDKFDNSAVIIKARTMTKPIKQWAVGREFNKRLKKRFDERDIEIPFPHVTLYMGKDKDGSAPPMNVRVSEKAAAAAG